MRSGVVAGVVALSGIIVAACGTARPVPLPPTATAAPTVRSEPDLGGDLIAGVQATVSALPLPEDSQSCPQAFIAYERGMVEALAHLLASPEAQGLSVDRLAAAFDQGTREAGIPAGSLLLELIPGPPEVYLAAAQWCGAQHGRTLYVLDRAGMIWRVGLTEGFILPGSDDVRWLGDRWAVISDLGSGLYALRVQIVAWQNGKWALVYQSDDPPRGESVLWNAPERPTLIFEGGHKRLRVIWRQPPCWTALETIYAWRDGTYEQMRTTIIEPVDCGE